MIAIQRYGWRALGLPYFNPHSLRHALARLGMEICRTPEELKAWSQNLGHDEVLTTFHSYGEVPFHRQRSAILSGRLASAMEDTERALEVGRAVLAATKKVA